jgi:hypothetical protein
MPSAMTGKRHGVVAAALSCAAAATSLCCPAIDAETVPGYGGQAGSTVGST